MGQFIDLTGQRFGRWTVINRAPDHFTKSGNRITMWNCICDCGNEKAVIANSLRKGTTFSCGCYSAEQKGKRLAERNKKNAKYSGASRDRISAVWRGILQRCYNESNECFYLYGGRGIKVCEEWRADYMAFRKWSYENGYDETAPYGECTLDRIDANGDYCPENCRWTTAKQQANNRRSNHLVSGFGKIQNIRSWADELQMPYDKLYHRLSTRNWSVERVVAET